MLYRRGLDIFSGLVFCVRLFFLSVFAYCFHRLHGKSHSHQFACLGLTDRQRAIGEDRAHKHARQVSVAETRRIAAGDRTTPVRRFGYAIGQKLRQGLSKRQKPPDLVKIPSLDMLLAALGPANLAHEPFVEGKRPDAHDCGSVAVGGCRRPAAVLQP